MNTMDQTRFGQAQIVQVHFAGELFDDKLGALYALPLVRQSLFARFVVPRHGNHPCQDFVTLYRIHGTLLSSFPYRR